MSEMTDSVTVPTLTLGWRLQMALSQSPHTRTAIATALGVDASTVGRWMNDKGAPPKKAYITQWAWLTRVPVEWLETGTERTPSPDGTTDRYRSRTAPVIDLTARSGVTRGHLNSPANGREAVQVPDTDATVAGAPNRWGVVRMANDQRRDRSRCTAQGESSGAEIVTPEKVAA